MFPESIGGGLKPLQMGFLPYLPQDNAGLEDTVGEAAVEAISSDLGRLLRAPAHEFWAAVRGDASLATCLDSYLQYSRWGACSKGSLWKKQLPVQARGWPVWILEEVAIAILARAQMEAITCKHVYLDRGAWQQAQSCVQTQS